MTQRRKSTPDEVYTPEEIRTRLAAELPRWRFADDWIQRTYKTSGWKATLMVVNMVGLLAEAAWHHPDMTVCFASSISGWRTMPPRASPTRTLRWPRRSRRC